MMLERNLFVATNELKSSSDKLFVTTNEIKTIETNSSVVTDELTEAMAKSAVTTAGFVSDSEIHQLQLANLPDFPLREFLSISFTHHITP